MIFFPGFYAVDSFAVLKMARTDSLNSLWSAPWALFVQIISINGSKPEFATLFFSAIFSISVTVFFYSLFTEKRAAIISGILQITPLVGAMGITLLHDIPMTAGFFFVATFIVRSLGHFAYKSEEMLKYLVPGMLLITFRGNGLPTVIILFLLLIAMHPKKSGRRYLIVGVLISLVFVSVSSSFLTDPKSKNFDLGTGWIYNDLSCYASTDKGKGFIERAIPGVGNTQKWSSKSACDWFSDAELSTEEASLARNQIIGAFFKLLIHDPKFVLMTHIQRHEYLVPIPINGLPRPPFIHSTIEYEDLGVKWAFPSLAEDARAFVRVWNYFNYLFAYSGFWLCILGLASAITRRKDLLLVFAFGFILNSSLFVLAGISDARYTLFILISGQGVALHYLLSSMKRLRNMSGM